LIAGWGSSLTEDNSSTHKLIQMQTAKISRAEKNFQGVSLIIAPLLFAASTFFWTHGEYSVPSATLIIFSMFFWIPALTGLFALLKNKMSRYAVWGLWIAVYGCISGCCFAFLGYFATIFNISHEQYLQTLSNYPVTSQILLFAAGPLFPLSVLLLGINLVRTKSVHVVIGVMLCLGAIAFPLRRVQRIEIIAHIADVLLLIPTVYLGLNFLNSKSKLSLV
jgi:hypothetical protein